LLGQSLTGSVEPARTLILKRVPVGADCSAPQAVFVRVQPVFPSSFQLPLVEGKKGDRALRAHRKLDGHTGAAELDEPMSVR